MTAIEQAALNLLENCTHDGNGNMIVPAWAMRALWRQCGYPNLTSPDRLLDDTQEVLEGDDAP